MTKLTKNVSVVILLLLIIMGLIASNEWKAVIFPVVIIGAVILAVWNWLAKIKWWKIKERSADIKDAAAILLIAINVVSCICIYCYTNSFYCFFIAGIMIYVIFALLKWDSKQMSKKKLAELMNLYIYSPGSYIEQIEELKNPKTKTAPSAVLGSFILLIFCYVCCPFIKEYFKINISSFEIFMSFIVIWILYTSKQILDKLPEK